MELGKAKLLRTGLNTLHQAIHPVHGIAWTDGRQVCLTSFYYVAGEPKFGDTNVIGQFEHVFGLFWGPLCCSGSPALLAVQHKKHVTVWQLQLSALEQNKLLCTQTCEMSEPFPLLSQGCVWHPRQDTLAVLTKQDASVLFSVRVDNRRVKADIRGSGQIHCACWTKDGTRLVVAIGSALHSYIWNDIQKSLVACSFCPVFDVGGHICAIESTDEAQVAVTTELPLDKICGLNAGIAFDLPNESKPLSSHQCPAVISEDDICSESRRMSFDSERSLPLGFISSSGSTDLTHILAKHRKSDPSPLIHLRRRDHLTGSGQDSSHLILVKYEKKVTTTRKVSIPGILVPDIMAFDPQGNIVAVASNTCNVVLVYSIMASSMPNVQQIHLQKNERPKGLCFLSSKQILVMLGRQRSNDPAFLPSSNTDKYILRLAARELVFDEGSCPTSPVVQKPESPSDLHEFRRHSEAYAKDFAVKDLVLPGGSVNLSSNIRKKLIEEVCTSESSSADFSDRATSSTSSITLENYDMDHVNRMATLAIASHANNESTRPSSPRYTASEKLLTDSPLLKNSCLAKENNLEQLANNMEKIFARFAEVQQCLSEIKDFTHNGKKLMSSYPSACEPQYVHVTCQTQLSENVYTDERRPVLLCEGKLCLRVLQELFNLTVMEMMHGPMWIILVADADGFVPLTFKHQEELTIRSAKRKLPFKSANGSNDLPLENQQI
ncbi:WD repeat and coiled-coil-containing protein [Pangasianodon hypophthalmus]|uniref:WD repeat and coiled-coil-containing protein n=1 Tax=Pangasianodon hypophthalmus TaxID=310915 RepID=UPI002307E511|nr:WD repeat and coiled-coil-containing protein [Pangasianodon hypophthalmus]XP_026800170.3 WD repeat and coiled-coil-containing protein [Pangasianodon hypophthalmus]XP_053097964.1 WD repeat and coiled-coil-containing protein [Pangasianodon hypophthalmus]